MLTSDQTKCLIAQEALEIWDVNKLTLKSRIEGGHQSADSCFGICISPNNKYLITGSDDMSIKIWDLEANECLLTIENAHADWVNRIVLTKDCQQFISTSWDSEIKVWDISGFKMD